MAHIRKREWQRDDGSTRTAYVVSYRDPYGRRRAKQFPRKRDADAFVVNVEHSKTDGSWVAPDAGKVTVGEWVARWLSTRVDLKPKTRVGYDSICRTQIMPTWERVPLSRVDHLGVAEWVAKMSATGLSPSRVRQSFNVLSAALDSAARSRKIAVNPARGVDLPRMPEGKIEPLSADQMQALADAATTTTDRLVLLTLGYVGLRFGEVVALRVGDLDPMRRRIHVRGALAEVNGELIFGTTKTHQSRTVAVHRKLADELAALVAGRDRDALVFITAKGGPIRYSNWRRRAFDVARDATGLGDDVTPHYLRHTAASLLIRSGASIKVVQQQLGHKSATLTLDRYGHLYLDELDDIADALDRTASAAGSNKRATNDMIVDLRASR